MPTRPASSASDTDDDALSMAAAGGFSRVLTLTGPWWAPDARGGFSAWELHAANN